MIAEDYTSGKTERELSIEYGLGEKRIRQILEAENVRRRARRQDERDREISPLHAKIGVRLYDYRFRLGQERGDVAEELGWSVHRVTYVEKGTHNLTLIDLQDLAAYIGCDMNTLTGA